MDGCKMPSKTNALETGGECARNGWLEHHLETRQHVPRPVACGPNIPSWINRMTAWTQKTRLCPLMQFVPMLASDDIGVAKKGGTHADGWVASSNLRSNVWVSAPNQMEQRAGLPTRHPADVCCTENENFEMRIRVGR